MGNEGYIMSIDIGTQSVRAIVFTPDGEIIANERIISEPYYSLQPGWAEVPADSIWQNVCIVTKGVAKQLGENINKVKACSITANRDNIIPLDEDNNYIRDWITWVDQRRTPEAIEYARKHIKGLEKIIHSVKKSFFDLITSRSKFNWFKFHEPETYKKTKKYLTMSGLITYKLIGKFHDSMGMQAGVLPFNTEKFDYYDIDLVYKTLGVKREQLADKLFHAGEIMGYVTEEASRVSGLPEGLPIIAAGGDKQCETLGSGSFSEKQAVISYGTMATIALTSKKYIKSNHFSYYTFPSTIAGAWNPEYNIITGYWLVTWFCRQYAKEQDFPSFIKEMNEEAIKIPPGSKGLFVYPFWAPHPELYPNARGSVIGLTDDHTKAHLFRAILEGIAYTLKDGLKLIQKGTKKEIEEIYIVGGGSKSDVAMQITADIFNVNTIRLQIPEVCALGAAIPAGIAVGMFKNEEDGLKQMLKGKEVFTPKLENVKIYEDIYENVYKKMYKTNESIFKTLRKYEKL